MKCQDITIKLNEIKSKKAIFEQDLENSNIKSAIILRQEIKQAIKKLKIEVWFLGESLPIEELKTRYEKNRNVLNKKELTIDKDIAFLDRDGNKYPMPSFEQLRKYMERPSYREKANWFAKNGFKPVLIPLCDIGSKEDIDNMTKSTRVENGEPYGFNKLYEALQNELKSTMLADKLTKIDGSVPNSNNTDHLIDINPFFDYETLLIKVNDKWKPFKSVFDRSKFSLLPGWRLSWRQDDEYNNYHPAPFEIFNPPAQSWLKYQKIVQNDFPYLSGEIPHDVVYRQLEELYNAQIEKRKAKILFGSEDGAISRPTNILLGCTTANENTISVKWDLNRGFIYFNKDYKTAVRKDQFPNLVGS